jgi:hypothetical protein
MPNSIINSDDGVSSGTTGLKTSGGDDGILKIQTNGVDAISVTGSQVCSFANNFGTVANLPAYQCRAWVNFDGTGTVAIRASGNVTSITDNGTGDYTVNFTTAMPDANYSAIATSNAGSNFGNIVKIESAANQVVGSVRVQTTSTSALQDAAVVCVSIFR